MLPPAENVPPRARGALTVQLGGLSLAPPPAPYLSPLPCRGLPDLLRPVRWLV